MRKAPLFALSILAGILLFLSSPVSVRAIPCSEPPSGADDKTLQEIEANCLAELSKVQKEKESLNKEIRAKEIQETTTRVRINQTQEKIKTLESEIATLSAKITRLDLSLDYISKVFLSRTVAAYKMGLTDPLLLIFSSKDIGEFLSKYKYVKAVQLHDRSLLLSMEETKVNYDEQKQLKEKMQKELADLKAVLERQKTSLVQQIADRKKLLKQTEGKEENFQRLLSSARAELASLKGFTQKQVGGVLPPQNSPDGWYYSQRDERWASKTIGDSSDKIYDVGCLVSSVAMIFTYYGQKATPVDIASNSLNFFSRTAYMSRPWPTPSGKTQISLSSLNQVDSELAAGRPVIIHLNLGGDGHFVVLKKKEGDDYIMHDPWYGYDKKLKDFYTVSTINKNRMVVYK